MEKRRLGKTDLELSVLGFGASPLGGVFGEVTRETAVETVATALDVRAVSFSPFSVLLTRVCQPHALLEL